MRIKPISILIMILGIITTTVADDLRSIEEMDSLSNIYMQKTSTEVGVTQIDTTFPLYYAYGYVTLDAPFDEVAPRVYNLDNYENVFNHVLDVRQVEDRYSTADSVFYIEGKTLFVHGWGLGEVTKLSYTTDSTIEVSIRPANDLLIDEYKEERRGVIRYYVKHVNLDGFLLKTEDNCRVGFRGVMRSNKPMPLWLLNLIINIILPNFLRDLENEPNS